MSEEKKKEQNKAVRIISIIALVAGIAMFLCGLLIVPIPVLRVIGSGIPDLLSIAACYSLLLFRCIIIPALVLSLVTLLFERNKYYRWLPLAFVVAGILLYLSCYLCIYIDNLRFLSGQPPPPPPSPP